jgi:DNA-binding transcriptional MerR regulator
MTKEHNLLPHKAHYTHPFVEEDTQSGQYLVPYDENLLERARTQWQFGDWESLAQLSRDTLQHHPDRAKLALLAAAGRLQTGHDVEARQFIRLAQNWGVSNKLVCQILIAGVHNSLGRAAALGGNQPRALKHFENAVVVGMPGRDAKLLTQARTREQLHQLELLTPEGFLKVGAGGTAATPPKLPPLTKTLETITEFLQQQKTELDAQLKKQDDDLIRVCKFLKSS